MEFIDFKYILTIAKCKSISKAAEELYITQPNLSKILMRIESEVGHKLFDRSRSPIQLTYVGEKYIKYAQKFLELHAQFQNELTEISNSQKGRILLGIPPTRGSYLLPQVLPRFHQLCPHVEIVITEQQSNNIQPLINSGQINLGIFCYQKEYDELCYEPLLDESMFLMVPCGHPLYYDPSGIDRFPVISPDHKACLEASPFISIDTSESITKRAIEFFRLWDIDCQILIRTKNNVTTYRLCEQGMGLAVIMEVAMKNTTFKNRPCFYYIGDPPITDTWYCAYRRGYRLNPSERTLVNIFKEEAETIQASPTLKLL